MWIERGLVSVLNSYINFCLLKFEVVFKQLSKSYVPFILNFFLREEVFSKLAEQITKGEGNNEQFITKKQWRQFDKMYFS